MEHLLRSVEQAVDQKNWYAALLIALTLPDVSAKVDGRKGKVGERYVSWAKEWIEPTYLREAPTKPPAIMREMYETLRDRTNQNAPRDFMRKMKSLASGPRVKTCLMTAGDLYALRCAYCHEYSHELENHNAKGILTRFHISEPPSKGSMHLNMKDDGCLQVQVDLFCLEISEGVRQWLASRGGTPEVKASLERISVIKPAFNF
ncbi:hypothetical protein [Rhizobium sp. RM]|uniref:hypothetical protein n=1 Tax=Rhizobium sp. RM TaxID=2748079 RepID=UPI00110F1D59|nr:hypothetical protein [Rhizobium sp. RM]NWJ24788.1 hypothetical protein [Rhizobium sp. RM]TMV16586.1 hypothetical protein BJG94_19315 [Rhizobium sp. Td3]